MIDSLVRWRYWLMPPDAPRLDPFGPHDKTIWHRKTRAECRRDQTHIPPAPGCTCGLYAMTLVDVRYSVECWRWINANIDDAFIRETLGSVGYLLHRKEALAEWHECEGPQPTAVIGRVRMRNAVETGRSALSNGEVVKSRGWRSRSAVIEALYVHAESAAAAPQLADAYGVPCEVGYPGEFSAKEWAKCMNLAGHLVGDVPSLPSLRYPSHRTTPFDAAHPRSVKVTARTASRARRSPLRCPADSVWGDGSTTFAMMGTCRGSMTSSRPPRANRSLPSHYCDS